MIKKIIFILVLYLYYLKLNKIDISKIKKKIIGFQINGVGFGHITQAITVYNILVDNVSGAPRLGPRDLPDAPDGHRDS